MSAATGARVALRARTGLEATDLGVAMLRAWWRPLATAWLALVLPFGVALVWLLRDSPGWSIAALWWLRPAFARVPLHVLSRELFGEHASLASTARALPGLCRSGLFTSLVTRRFSFLRTFLQPVLQLEGLRGRARNARAAVLARQDTGAAVALATVVAHLNGALMLGLLGLVSLLTPQELEWSVLELVMGEQALPGIFPALYLAGISVFEPLLVASGFALYVNRRVFLEGWEIELAFRRLAARTPGAAHQRRFAAAVAALLALWLAAPPGHASDCVPEDPDSAKACVREVLRHPDFGTQKRELRWMPKELARDAAEADGLDLAWLGGLAQGIARLAQVLLYGGLAVGLAALLLALRGARGERGRDQPPVPPRSLLGLDLDPESLPEDVAVAARAAWRSGEPIAALSVLYRGALVKLAARGALEIPESATELECVRAVRQTQAERVANVFAALTSSWTRTRYAHQPPSEAEFTVLCADFAAFEQAP